jgi:hypothetical protein
VVSAEPTSLRVGSGECVDAAHEMSLIAVALHLNRKRVFQAVWL